MTRTIDLNADVGEGMPGDAELIPLVTSANIACGGHAGDDSTMEAAVAIAIRAGVTVGAHPGHEDREHFGRRALPITPSQLHELLTRQVNRLHAILAGLGGDVRYLKLHGALYHQAGRDPALAAAVVDFIDSFHTSLVLLGQAGTPLEAEATQADIPFYAEAFADRVYQVDGSLAPRSEPGSSLATEQLLVKQALGLAVGGLAQTIDKQELAVRCDSLCLHGDGELAVANARAIRKAFESEGIALRAFCS